VGGLAFAGFVIYSLFTLEPVKVVRSHLEHDGNRVFVAGAVHNTADHPRGIELEVHLRPQWRPFGRFIRSERASGGCDARFKKSAAVLEA
jgi:hypothetical protein